MSGSKNNLQIEKQEKVDLNIGLTDLQVSERKKQGLINFVEEKKNSFLRIFIKNVFRPLNIVIFACAIFIYFLGLYRRLFFVVTISINTMINLFQDIKLRKILNSLSFSSKNQKTFVLRDGKKQLIFFREVVLDDIVILKKNSIVPSDSVVMEGFAYVDESFLTGEQKHVLKQKGDFLYAETIVIEADCKVRVVKVGKDNYISKLQNEISVFSRPKRSIITNLIKYVHYISFVIFFIVVSEFFVVFLKKQLNNHYILDAVISSLLTMISSGIFLMFSLMLILWSLKLLKSNILVNEMFSIENLVSTNVLCLDKTGTITNYNSEYEEIIDLQNIGTDFLESVLHGFVNDESEKNLTIMAFKRKIKPKQKIVVDKYIPFDSEKKYSAIVVGNQVFVLGACEFINTTNKDVVQKEVQGYEKNGFRTLILAKSNRVNEVIDNKTPSDLTTIGIVLLSENINKNVKETLDFLKKHNVNIVVISGDSDTYLKQTLKKINFDNCKIVSLFGVDDNTVRKLVADGYNVFARSNPEQKKIIIETFKNKKLITTMIGDGVNDLKALKIADCSITMPNGHDITKKISNFVLLKPDFKNIIFLLNESNKVIIHLQRIYSLFFAKIFSMIFLSFFYIVLSLTYNLFFPFRINNLIAWEMISLGLFPIISSFDKDYKNIDISKFFNSIFSNSVYSYSLLLSVYFTCFLSYFFGLLSYNEHVCLSILLLSFTSLVVNFFICCFPITKFRIFNIVSTFFLMVLYFLVDYLMYKKVNFSITDLKYSFLSLNIFIPIIIVLFLIFIYCFFAVKRYKKNNSNNKKV